MISNLNGYLKSNLFGYLLFACISLISGYQPTLFATSADQLIQNAQTDVDRAEHIFDDKGVPILKIEGIGEQRHPGWIAIYALAYAGIDAYDKRLLNLTDKNKFQACIDWLTKNLKQRNDGLWVWEYHFDSTYNDISIKAPWASAFGQATGIQALLAAYKLNQNPELLDLAKKAAQSLVTPIAQGGFLFKQNNDIWFEEIPIPIDNPTHILNGHMRALLALKELADVTHEPELQAYFKAGCDTLYRWLPRYDTGYWLRYDLNPKKSDLLFRLANPYGFDNYPLAIHKIALRDPVTKEEVVLHVGADGDSQGGSKIAGIHWGQPETIFGRQARRLVPAALENKPDELAAPHSYFYLALPGKWTNNLRNDWFELVIDYYDEARANITVQQRSIAPGQTFRDMKDGDLHLTGAGQWRQWIIPVRPSALGFWVGESYADKHAQYLKKLEEHDSRFKKWSIVSKGYLNTVKSRSSTYTQSSEQLKAQIEQVPMLPYCSIDSHGVLLVHQAGKNSKFLSNGTFDMHSDKGSPQYNPFIIADQLIKGSDSQCSNIPRNLIKRIPALNWLLNSKNQAGKRGYVNYNYNFKNIYNDVVTNTPWTSAFSQAYVLKALQYAVENNVDTAEKINPLIQKVANSFDIDVAEGGVSAITKESMRFFEEVPNATHVLNAHLISVNELAATSRYLNSKDIYNLSWQGVLSLKDKLYLFDTGYWLRYDLNPKKELLFQIDWLNGDKSPLIESIELQNPETKTKTVIQAGAAKAFEGAMHLSGTDWQPDQLIDGRRVRSFQNGYKVRKIRVKGGTRQNVYFFELMPTQIFSDDFDVPVHQLVIRYKDIASGQFNIKIQAVNEGNYLSFVPLRNGVIHTIGDQQWKTAYISVRPQDLGWYVAPDYQQYEVDQIQRIANLTNDWFFYQYAQKQRDYLESKSNNKTVLPKSYAADKAEKPTPIAVIIKGSSPTYPGYSFKQAFSREPDKHYVAGIEGQKKAYVDLELKKSMPLSEISIRWENVDNFSKKISLLALDNKKLKELVQIDVKHGGVSHINLPHPKNIKKLRLEFSDFSGQPRVLLRQIQLWSKSTGKTSIDPISQVNLDEPSLSATDPKNPLHIFRLPVTQKIKKLSDELSIGAQNDHEKILRFMDYIGNFRVGFATDATPDVTIQEQIGACGSYTNTLLALAAAQGIKGRIISLLNSPVNDGHALSELLVDGKWHLYDPTFNAFYSLNDQLLPLSFSEIKKICKTQPASIHLNARVYRPEIDSYTGCPIFINASPSGVIGPDHVMIFPLQLGNNNLNKIKKKDFGPKYQGADFIGAASTNQHQEWHLKNLSVGDKYEFIIQPESIGGDISASDRSFAIDTTLTNGQLISNSYSNFDFSNSKTLPLVIKFVAQKPEVNLKVTHPYLGPKYRYIRISSYELKKIVKGG
jgi:hypothetical protein